MINWWFIGLFAVVTLVASTVLAYPLRRHKLLCLLTVPLIFILTSTGYFMWGGFPQWQEYLQQEDKKILAQKMLESVKSPDELISKLREKLDDSPKSAKGWYLLGRIYMSQNAHMQAVSAFAKAHQLEPENEQFTVNYAYSMWQFNKRHFTSVLNPHHARELSLFFPSPEAHTIIYFVAQIVSRHVRLVPAVFGDDTVVSLRGIVDDGK